MLSDVHVRGEKMFVLERLWKGDIRPSERRFREDGRYAELMHEAKKIEDVFYEELSAAGKKIYKDHYDLQLQMLDISEQDAFIQGVLFGARFMLDVISEYQSPMPQVDG